MLCLLCVLCLRTTSTSAFHRNVNIQANSVLAQRSVHLTSHVNWCQLMKRGSNVEANVCNQKKTNFLNFVRTRLI